MHRLPDLAYRLIGRFSATRFDRVLHPMLYRLAGGRGVLGREFGAQVILVTARGRRTGRPRTVALFGFRDAGGWIVVASRGGTRQIPAWYRNLVADATEATIQVRRATAPVRARELAGDEYEAAFEVAATAYPGYRLYRRESPHHIPLLRLEPR